MRERKHHAFQKLAAVLSLLMFAFMANAENPAAVQTAGHSMQMSTAHEGGNTIDIIRDPADVPSPTGNRGPTVVHVELTAEEVTGQLDPASTTIYRYWTFNGKVPAPMIRVRQGDTVEVTLRNDPGSQMVHSVDFHAALGPGGGAVLSQTLPGQSTTFTFQATTAGLFVYHCGTPMIAEHIANGMYGLILVEPAGGLPRVDHEYYVMQGEVYTTAPKGKSGLQQFSGAKLMQEDPEYYIFNGAVDALTKQHSLKANAGETVRIFFGDAGPNKPSSLHMVGEIFTQEYEAGSLASAPLTNVQTALVAPGSAAILELKAVEPGQFSLMDHAMARMAKGLLATLDVTGPQNATLMHAGGVFPETGATLTGMTEADLSNASSKGDADAVSIGKLVRENAGASPKGAGAHEMSMHNSNSAKASGKVQTYLAMGATSVSKSNRDSPKELNGCLTEEIDGKVMLKVLHSQKTYRLEARPLQFAENSNRLVHVTGYFGSVVEVEDPRVPSFVVNTIDELAPNCSAKISPAVWREVLARNGSGRAAAEHATTVGMTEMAFTPITVVIHVGEEVVWKNSSQTVHNVVSDPGKAINKADVQLPPRAKSFSSVFLQAGQTFSHVFTIPGTYRYVCTLHELNGMKGTVVVK